MRFHPPWWAWLLALTGMAIFAALGVWQLQRGEAKRAYLAQFQRLPAQTLTLSAELPAPAALTLQHAAATGRWLPERQLLQDGQSREGRPGYHVWTPLQLASGGLVLVNRGWIPQPFDPDRQRLAVAEGEVTVQGLWRSLPEPGLRLAPAECRRPDSFPAVVIYPQAGQLACILDQPTAPGLLLLDPLAPGGFVREWSVMGIPPERHYGYAVTWFALGLTAMILFVALNLDRNDSIKN